MGEEKVISAIKCCVLQAQDAQALEKLVTLFVTYIISETTGSQAMHLKSQQSLLCFMLLPQPILGMTAFYLHEQSVTSVKETKLVKKCLEFFFLFFFPYDNKQSAVSAILPVLSLSLQERAVASKYILCILKFNVNICIICVREALLPMQKSMFS